MKPETTDYLAKALDDLGDARTIAAVGLAKVAARSAYYAAFHAAEAVIFELSGKITKTHSGVRTALAQQIRDRPDIDKSFLTFLAQSYKYKAICDYSIGREATVTMAEAEDAIARATAIISSATTLLEME